MNINAQIKAFDQLGRFMSKHTETRNDQDLSKLNEFFHGGYQQAIQQAQAYNNWFTLPNLTFALDQWGQALAAENINEWIAKYPETYFAPASPKTVALITAGNIPLVGFHDFLSVLISGHNVLVKPSSDDQQLLPFLAQVLVAINPNFAQRITFADGKIQDFDAVIATGSDNSARYFEHYFGKYPHIIRKNRSSVAILTGDESDADLQGLAEDIFRYFGLGCRNISKVYLPEDFDVNRIFEASLPWQHVMENKSYANNYDYHRAILMMEKQDFLENGVFTIQENNRWHAPVSMLFYQRYTNLTEVENEIKAQAEQLQCVATMAPLNVDTVKLGETQKPGLGDYADHVDTLAFLGTLG